MKTSILSFAVNDKFPIDIAYRQFKKYLKDDFEYVVLNDAYDPEMEKNINTIAAANQLKCVRVPQHIHAAYKTPNPSACYALSLNWAVHDYAKNNGCEIIALVHTDVFPLCDVSIQNILGENIVASVTEFRIKNGTPITYLYPALTIINMKLLKNPMELDFGIDDGLDTGGRSRFFIENNPNSVKFMANHQTSYFLETLSDEPIKEYFKEDLAICRSHGLNAGWISEGFYHYMAGSQWNADNLTFAEGHKKKMDLFLKFFY